MCHALSALQAEQPSRPAPLAAPADASTPWSLLAALPEAVDAAAVLDRPADLLLTDPAGSGARALLARTGLFAQTQRAWAGLADALGYTQEEAARALLGRRVVIAWAGLTDNAPGLLGPAVTAARADSGWLVIAEIDRSTADAVRTRLRPAPRRTLEGRVIYSIDAGRTTMALLDDDGAVPDAGRHTRVLIAPAEGVGLLETVVTASAAGPDRPINTLGDGARAMLGPTRPGWAAIGAIRPREATAPSVIEFRTAGPAWGVRFAAPSEQSMANGAPIGVLTHVPGDALLAAAFAEGPRFGPDGLDLRFDLAERPNKVEAQDTDDKPTATFELRHGTVVTLLGAGPVREAGGTPAMVGQVITHAAADADTHGDAHFAEHADRLMSLMIGGDNPPAHRGRFPDAVRTHSVAPSGDDDATKDAWPGDHARVAWAIAPDAPEADGANGANGANGAGEPRARSGVMSLAFGPRSTDPAPAARAGRDAWIAGHADTDPTMLAAGRARPADLIALLNPSTDSPLLTMAASIDRMEWTIRLREGVARGELLLRLRDNPARLGSP